MWWDTCVTRYIDKKYPAGFGDTLLLSRNKAFVRGESYVIRDKIDYWYNSDDYENNYTIYTLLQIIRKHFTNKKILLFGVDLDPDLSSHGTHYDEKKDAVIDREENQTADYLDTLYDILKVKYRDDPGVFRGVYNCSPLSRLKFLHQIKPEEIYHVNQ